MKRQTSTDVRRVCIRVVTVPLVTFTLLGVATAAAAAEPPASTVAAVSGDPSPDATAGPYVQIEVPSTDHCTSGKYCWKRTLRRGDSGADVLELQIRVAGWVNSADGRSFQLDGSFGPLTETAVKNFQTAYGLESDGVAGPLTQAQLNTLQDSDGTLHFSFAEFAARESGNFRGGKVGETKVRENVRRLMYRLEALRKKRGDRPVKITSGFRTVSRNSQVGGAPNSQHMYGIAADNQISSVANRTARNSARASAFAAIFCYQNSRHNHFDIRLNNPDGGGYSIQDPPRDGQGRDLDSKTGQPCYGESGTSSENLDLLFDASLDDGLTGLYLDLDE